VCVQTFSIFDHVIVKEVNDALGGTELHRVLKAGEALLGRIAPGVLPFEEAGLNIMTLGVGCSSEMALLNDFVLHVTLRVAAALPAEAAAVGGLPYVHAITRSLPAESALEKFQRTRARVVALVGEARVGKVIIAAISRVRARGGALWKCMFCGPVCLGRF
jgi:succinyl-CoA synthetase alpha subunit